MNVTLRQLTYFKALAEQRNFGRAAQTCHVSQPALSVQIRDLEASLGAPLVERQARDVVLTGFGRQVLAHAQRILAEVDALGQVARWRDGLSGHLALGVIPTIAPYILPDALSDLRARDISLDVQVREGKTERLLDMLRRGELDVAVMALPCGDDTMVELPLFEDRFLLAGTEARIEGLRRDTSALRPTELGNGQLLLLEDGHCLTDQALEVCGRKRDHAKINMGATSLATLSRLVEAGFGLTLIPELAAASEVTGAPGLRVCRFSGEQPSRRIGLVRRAGSAPGAWLDELAEILTRSGRRRIAEAEGVLMRGGDAG
ncbi:hydrogen peroxide-inducible genes activator [Mesobacterium pallidum]|uniref:hydrogen peroxide-inducible genes activator n=1 Tax=Mesobacterium pallidum TaxID=2872037 RepID=UPI001EE327A4|nr:hydrogen peroxide-inducible genes activator [Mesobacterium pallidum]